MRRFTRWVWVLGALWVASGCDEAPVPLACDGGACVDAPVCSSAAECSDGLFCNGAEVCAAGVCAAGEAPCAGACEEATGSCETACTTDADLDGHRAFACGGDDCDDDDPNRYPGNTEVCDADDHDEDCDLATYGIRDADGDAFPDARCCNGEGAERQCGSDCDDSLAIVHPTLPEACDGLDNDCDELVDEGVLGRWIVDSDGDGHGSDAADAEAIDACFMPVGYAASDDDCDDGAGGVNPGVPERCDGAGVDENCDGVANPAALCTCTGDQSRDCVELPGACASGRQSCVDGAWSACSIAPISESCNGVDDDCDGSTDEGVTVTCYADGDNDGYAVSGAATSQECSDSSRPEVGGCPASRTNRAPLAADLDCDGTRADVNPGRVDVCNGIDDDCDGPTDEGVSIECYVDNDGDTYSPSATSAPACPDPARGIVGGCPVGRTNRSGAAETDCNDTASAISPAASEVCDSAAPPVDENCDGLANPPADCDCVDGTSRSCPQPGVCAEGTQSCSGGAWGGCSRLPATEVCNGLDDDCDGSVDNGVGFVCQAGQTQNCTTGCTTPGTQSCNATCTAFNDCAGPEVCNDCDDDGDGVRDDGFLCRQGEAGVSCTTGCLTEGRGTCNSTCDGAIACVATAETCNYCDDDGDGTRTDEMFTNSSAQNYLSCDEFTLMGGAACTDVPDFNIDLQLATAGVTDTVTAAWVSVPHVMGHGPFRIGFDVLCENEAGVPRPSGDGVGFSLLLAHAGDLELGEGITGPAEYATGVPTNQEGMAYEVWARSNLTFMKTRLIQFPAGNWGSNFAGPAICEGPSTRTTFYIWYLPGRTAVEDDQMVITNDFCVTPYDEATCPSYVRGTIDRTEGRDLRDGMTFYVGFAAETTSYAPTIRVLEQESYVGVLERADNLCSLSSGIRVVGEAGAGRLEVLNAGIWGTVCSDGFGDVDADVACRQMGYSSGTSLGASVPDGVGTVWLDELACTGAESSLTSCPSAGLGVEDCTHAQDVGVSCVP